MSSQPPTIHILRSIENGLVFAHAHDETSYRFLEDLVGDCWGNVDVDDEGQLTFDLYWADQLVQRAKSEGIAVEDGVECLPPEVN